MEVNRISAKTILKLGEVEAPVATYKTTGDPPGARKYDTAGPNGKPLRMETRGQESKPEDVPAGDAFGVEAEAAPPETAPAEPVNVLIEEGTGELVRPEDVRKGIRKEDGTFIDLTDHLERITQQSNLDRMEVVGFLAVSNVPRERVEGCYYLAAGDLDPEKHAPTKVLRLLYEGLRVSHRAAIVRWTKRAGQNLGVIVAHRTGTLVLLQLTFAERWRAPNDRCVAHLQADVRQTEIDAVEDLIGSMPEVRAGLDGIRDRRAQLTEELNARAEAGELDDFQLDEELEPAVEELEDVLRASVEA